MKRTPLRAVSKKRAKLNRERTKVLKRIVHGKPCSARLPMCTGMAVDGHEVLTRARGGSIVDEANIRPVCRACHRWITEHPMEAHAIGWILHTWEKVPVEVGA